MPGATSDKSLSKLIKNLKSKNESLRKQAVFKLGEMKSKKAVKGLINLIKKEKIEVIKRNATRALGKIQDAAALNALCKLLFDNDYYVKQNAAWALGKIKDNHAVGPLLRLIKGGGAKIYTESGSDSKVSDSGALDDTLKTDGMKYIDVQVKAIKALGEIGDEKVIDGLVAELEEEEEGNVRCAIALALGKIGSKKAVPKLIEMLEDTIWYVRRDVAKALGQIGDLQVVDALIRKLTDKYQKVGENCAKAIGKIGPLAIGRAFLLCPKNEKIKDLVKNNFKSKQELIDNLLQVVKLEQNPTLKEELKNKISQLSR